MCYITVTYSPKTKVKKKSELITSAINIEKKKKKLKIK